MNPKFFKQVKYEDLKKDMVVFFVDPYDQNIRTIAFVGCIDEDVWFEYVNKIGKFKLSKDRIDKEYTLWIQR